MLGPLWPACLSLSAPSEISRFAAGIGTSESSPSGTICSNAMGSVMVLRYRKTSIALTSGPMSKSSTTFRNWSDSFSRLLILCKSSWWRVASPYLHWMSRWMQGAQLGLRPSHCERIKSMIVGMTMAQEDDFSPCFSALDNAGRRWRLVRVLLDAGRYLYSFGYVHSAAREW